jgi:hypothetical protein
MSRSRTAQLRHAEYYASILQEADELFTRGGNDTERGLEVFDVNRENIIAAQAWSEKRASDDEVVARVCHGFGINAPFILDLRQSSRENISNSGKRLMKGKCWGILVGPTPDKERLNVRLSCFNDR